VFAIGRNSTWVTCFDGKDFLRKETGEKRIDHHKKKENHSRPSSQRLIQGRGGGNGGSSPDKALTCVTKIL